jgi:hypothetical protein
MVHDIRVWIKEAWSVRCTLDSKSWFEVGWKSSFIIIKHLLFIIFIISYLSFRFSASATLPFTYEALFFVILLCPALCLTRKLIFYFKFSTISHVSNYWLKAANVLFANSIQQWTGFIVMIATSCFTAIQEPGLSWRRVLVSSALTAAEFIPVSFSVLTLC